MRGPGTEAIVRVANIRDNAVDRVGHLVGCVSGNVLRQSCDDDLAT
jgi:hypothetical protein